MQKRLSKILAAAGVASRRVCEEMIFAGRVTVNDKVIRLPQTLVDLSSDRIAVDRKKIQEEEKKVYFLLNKPLGYLCTSVVKPNGARRVLDLFSHLPFRLFTVGRLDQETTGVIIVTNDGLFANRVIHPSYGVSKEYIAKTQQEITLEHLKILSKGIRIQGTFVQPLSVTKVRRGTVKIAVSEGKKHEVRKMLENAKLEVRELSRIRIGSLILGSLALGEYRELTKKEVEAFSLILS